MPTKRNDCYNHLKVGDIVLGYTQGLYKIQKIEKREGEMHPLLHCKQIWTNKSRLNPKIVVIDASYTKGLTNAEAILFYAEDLYDKIAKLAAINESIAK